MNKIHVERVFCVCVLIGAIGGFGGAFCGNAQCVDAWRQAAAGSLSAAGALGTYLANPPSGGP
jgi:hypothetical protein